MNKQIEEMANDLRKSEHWVFDDHDCDFELDRKKTAENLYNADYRKQIEGEWIDKHCSICGEEEPYTKRGNAFATTFYQFRTKFCPNCGAHMRGDKQ